MSVVNFSNSNSNEINLVPINKGGTGATDVMSALKNLNLLNNNLNSTPSCSALTYRNYTDFGLESMTMFSFAALLADYSTVIFSTSKYAKAYISDSPTDEGIILFTRGGLNHRVALFFSTANNNRGVVYQWSANSQILFQNWTKINDGGIADTIKNTLPINKGGTGATDVMSALKNLNLLNNNLNSTPSCSALTYRNYTDFGLESMTMFSFAALLADYSTIIFSTSKYAKAYISDAPTDEGIILFTRGGLNHRVALFFSTANNNRGLVYQWSANSQILFQNWTKINDGGNADTIKNTLPITKGGTGATDVMSALKNLNILNHTFSGMASCSPLMYKSFADFGIASTRMFEFGGLMPDYSSVIFFNSKTASEYITDAPDDTGLILFMRGALNHRVALFFSTAGKYSGNVYQWASNSRVLLQNWRKINDGGNADTLDGKHANDFVIAKQVNSFVSNDELNNGEMVFVYD